MKAAASLAFVFACFLWASTMTYNDKAAASAERAVANAAPLWSKKCERQGKRLMVKQADGKKPEYRCTDARELHV